MDGEDAMYGLGLEADFLLETPRRQAAAALHELAANRVLEVLDFIAIGRPVEWVRVGHAEQGSRLAQALA